VFKVRLNKSYFILLVMSSMIFLSSSSFFLSDYLTKKLNNNNFSEVQFYFALQKNYKAALRLEEKKYDIGTNHWLKFNRILAKSEGSIALKLGYWYQQKANEERSINGNNTSTLSAIVWFEQAIRLNSQKAIVALAQLHYQNNNLIKAQLTLNKLSIILSNSLLVEEALRLRFKIAIYDGNVALVKQLLNDIKSSSHIKTKRLLANINKYGIVTSTIENDQTDQKLLIKNKNNNNVEFENTSNCVSSLQLFATNLKHLQYLEVLIKGFNKKSISTFICIPTPLYVSKKDINCLAKSQQAITCDELLWKNVAKGIDSRHIGLILEEGGANVHLGILYIDAKDDINVFSHEVSHLLGFIDEYPLNKNHNICKSSQNDKFSHNIAVLKEYYRGTQVEVRNNILKGISWAHLIKESTPILVRVSAHKKNYWRLGTPLNYQDEIGVYLSETCEKSTVKNNLSLNKGNVTDTDFLSYAAFKPLQRLTQLRYYVNAFPKEYIKLITDNPLAYLMPSFHYNIALATYQQKKVIDATYWLKRASQWEKNPSRKNTILKGQF